MNRTKFKTGVSVVAVLAPKKAGSPFYLARVMKVYKQKLQVHWFGSKKLDSTYILEYGKKRQKGLGPPNVATIWKHTVIDSVQSMTGKKKGTIPKKELERLVLLASQAQKKKNT